MNIKFKTKRTRKLSYYYELTIDNTVLNSLRTFTTEEGAKQAAKRLIKKLNKDK